MERLGGKKWRTAIPTPSSGTSIRLVISWRRPWTPSPSAPTRSESPNDIKAGVVRFVKKPAVAVSLAGVGVLVVVVVVRRIRRR